MGNCLEKTKFLVLLIRIVNWSAAAVLRGQQSFLSQSLKQVKAANLLWELADEIHADEIHVNTMRLFKAVLAQLLASWQKWGYNQDVHTECDSGEDPKRCNIY